MEFLALLELLTQMTLAVCAVVATIEYLRRSQRHGGQVGHAVESCVALGAP